MFGFLFSKPSRCKGTRVQQASQISLEALEDRCLLTSLTSDSFSAVSVGDYGPFWVSATSEPILPNGVHHVLFSGQTIYQSLGSNHRIVADDYFAVEPNSRLALTGWAKSGDELGLRFDAANQQSFGLEAYDSDRHRIQPEHVLKHTAATDTVLIDPLNLGDTFFRIDDATGWSTADDAGTRSLAWYGYENSDGFVYPNYSYTRNVATDPTGGMWPTSGVNLATGIIALTEPWSGPTIPAGTAVRNATTGNDHSGVALDRQSVQGDFTFRQFTAMIEGIDVGSGAFSSSLLPAGTAMVRPVLSANLHGQTNNQVNWRDVEIHSIDADATLEDLQPAVVQTFSSSEYPLHARVAGLPDAFTRPDAFVKVDQDKTYVVSATVLDIANEIEKPLGIESYDIDGNLIHSLHVTRFAGSTDTTLAAALNPGDQTIFLSNGQGWSNEVGATAESRSIAWYGYTDSKGHTWPDYTYTRNVASHLIDGIWNPGALSHDGTTGQWNLSLNEPWQGPAIAAGTAVRNATGHEHHDLFNVETSFEDWTFISNNNQPRDKFDYAATFGNGSWQEGNPDVSMFRPGTAYIKPIIRDIGRYSNDWLKLGPVGSFPITEPQVATFYAKVGVTLDRSGQSIVSDQEYVIDPSQKYQLTAELAAGDTIDGTQPTAEEHSAGYQGFDVDGNSIQPQHVTKYHSARDTTLAEALNPGDTQIVLSDAAGWSNDNVASTRAIAWYGYSDQQGSIYPDYSYTRNVAYDGINGLWDVGSIEGNRITLRQPWSGPALTAGSSVRNAVGGSDLYATIAERQIVENRWSVLSAIVTGEWQNGIPSNFAFPPGTANIRLAAMANESDFTQDEAVHIRRMTVAPIGNQSVQVNDSSQISVPLDVLANDEDRDQLSITSVVQPQYGTVSILSGAGPDGRDLVNYKSERWFVGTDTWTYTTSNTVTSEIQTATATISVNGLSILSDSGLDNSIRQQSQVPADNLSTPSRTRYSVLSQWDQHVAESGQTLNANGLPLPSLAEFSTDADDDTLAYRLVSGVQHGTLSFSPHGSFEYTSDADFSGDDSFSYEVTDGTRSERRSALIRVLRDSDAVLSARMKELGLALHNYHDVYQQLPYVSDAPDQFDDNGVPHLSWRVHLLPFLGYLDLYQKFNLNEPWNSANNLPLLDQMPDEFRAPGDARDSTTTRQQIIYNPNDLASGTYLLNRKDGVGTIEMGTLKSFSDGLANTILVAQSGQGKAVPWTAPLDLHYAPESPLKSLGLQPEERLNLLIGNGEVLDLHPSSVTATDFHRMVTKSGDDVVDPQALQRLSNQLDSNPLQLEETSQNKFQQILDALHNYHDVHYRFPVSNEPSHFDVNGQPFLSWRVHVLPYLGFTSLYDQFRLDEPWDSPSNLPLMEQMPDLFRAANATADSTTTLIQTFTGPNTPFPTDEGILYSPRLRDFIDGVDHTILFAETGPDKAVPWTAPIDIAFDVNDPYAGLGDLSSGEIRVAMVGGSHSTIGIDLPDADFAALVTLDGSEILDGNSVFTTEENRTGIEQTRDENRTKLKHLLLAAHNYSDVFNGLPVYSNNPNNFDESGRPHLSWRVHLLPFLGHGDLYEQFDLTQPWNSPTNLPLLELIPLAYQSIGGPLDTTDTRFQVFEGPNSPWPFPNDSALMKGPRFRDITDGTTNTIMIVETGPEVAVPWTKPDDIDFDPASLPESLGTLPGGILPIGMMDGAVRSIKPEDNMGLLAALVTPQGSEIIPKVPGAAIADVLTTPLSGDNLVIAEGQLGSIEVVLSKPGDVQLFVSLSRSGVVTRDKPTLNFTTENWNQPQTITFHATDDDLIDAAKTTIATISVVDASSNDEFDALPDIVIPIFNVNDDVLPGFQLLRPESFTSLTESETSPEFRLILNGAPQSDVVFKITSGNTLQATVSQQTITITPQNWQAQHTFAVTAVDDQIVDGDQLVTIRASVVDEQSDNAFDALVDQRESVLILDQDQASVSIGDLSLLEGETSPFTISLPVTLNAEVDSDVTVSFTTTNGSAIGGSDFTQITSEIVFEANSAPDTVKYIDIQILGDRIEEADEQFRVQLTSIQANGRDVVFADAEATVTLQNDDFRGVIVSDVNRPTTESGGTATFTVALKSRPTNSVTIDLSSSDLTEGTVTQSIVFTTDNWNASQTVVVTGVDDDVDDDDQQYFIEFDAAVGGDYEGIQSDSVALVNTDDDALGIDVTDISGNTSETGTDATFNVVLNSEPTQTVTIPVASSDLSEGAISVTSFVFTPANWNVPQNAIVTGINDDVDDGDIEYKINFAAAVGGDYEGLQLPHFLVKNIDDDVRDISVSQIAGPTTESGNIAEFTIVLNSEPTADVTINLASSDLSEGTIDTPSITFTPDNWAFAKTVKVTGLNDDVDDGDQQYFVEFSAAVGGDYNGLQPESISVVNQDDDSRGIAVSDLTGKLSENGDSARFDIRLTSQPTTDVTIPLTSTDTTEGLVQPNLHFTTTNWNQPQTVIISSVNDDVDDGDIAFTVQTGPASGGDYEGLNSDDVLAINFDDDVRGFSITDISANTSENGDSATFSIRLNSEPTDVVTIPISSSDTSEGTVSTSELTFSPANWNSAQSVIVTGVDDIVRDGDQTFSIVTGPATGGDYDQLNPNDVVVINVDTFVTPDITVADAIDVTEGLSSVFTVSLSERPTAVVTVSYTTQTQSAGSTDFESKQGLLTFYPGKQLSQQILIPTINDLWVEHAEVFLCSLSTATNGEIVRTTAVAKILDNDQPVVSLSGNVTIEEGQPAEFTISLDQPPVTAVKVTFSTADATAASPTDFTGFTSHVLTFEPGASTFQNIAIQTINDSQSELDEMFHFIIDEVQAGIVDESHSSAIATLLANDIPRVTIHTTGFVTEGNVAEVRISIDQNPAEALSVDFATINGSAIGGSDFQHNSGTLTFIPGGSLSQTILIPTVTDFDVELDESLQIKLTNGVNSLIVYESASIVIQDNDVPFVSISDVIVTEGEDAVFVVSLSQPPVRPLSVDVSTIDGSAMSPDDFQSFALSTITFSPGESTSKQIRIPTLNDTQAEQDETFIAILSNAVGGLIIDKQATATILSEDIPRVIIMSQEPAPEGNNLAFTISLDQPPLPGHDVRVTVSTANGTATSGADFESFTRVLTFQSNGPLEQQIEVTALQDELVESTEQFTVQLTDSINSEISSQHGTATASILNITLPKLTISDAEGIEGSVLQFQVTLDQTPVMPVTLFYYTKDETAISLVDFIGVQNGSLTFEPGGPLTQTINIFTINDTELEIGDNETFRLLIDQLTGSTTTAASATGTIIDNDRPQRPVLDDVARFPGAAPTITWPEVRGAIGYEVWVGRVFPGTSRVLRSVSKVTSPKFTPPTHLTPGYYKVWVRAEGKNGYGTWSRVQHFEVQPKVIGPVTPTFNQRPEFQWEAIPEATTYELYVKTSTGNVIFIDIASTTFTPPSDLGQVLRWWIRPSDAIGNRGYSQAAHVGTQSEITQLSGDRIRWTQVGEAGRYLLWITNTDTAERVVSEDQIIGEEFIPADTLPAGSYKGWVKAVDSATGSHLLGQWSDAFYAIINRDGSNGDLPSLDVEITAPTERVETQNPTISWTTAEGADRYQVFVRRVGHEIVINEFVSDTFHLPVLPLTDGQYRVWIKALSDTGRAGAWSRPVIFEVETAEHSHDQPLSLNFHLALNTVVERPEQARNLEARPAVDDDDEADIQNIATTANEDTVSDTEISDHAFASDKLLALILDEHACITA